MRKRYNQKILERDLLFWVIVLAIAGVLFFFHLNITGYRAVVIG